MGSLLLRRTGTARVPRSESGIGEPFGGILAGASREDVEYGQPHSICDEGGGEARERTSISEGNVGNIILLRAQRRRILLRSHAIRGERNRRLSLHQRSEGEPDKQNGRENTVDRSEHRRGGRGRTATVQPHRRHGQRGDVLRHPQRAAREIRHPPYPARPPRGRAEPVQRNRRAGRRAGRYDDIELSVGMRLPRPVGVLLARGAGGILGVERTALPRTGASFWLGTFIGL
mmetsp:Transcript_25437/g.61141  ORF Transcript_25437/g.61141 Transcript_25437/m.61141 type:complete len:231 (-) Transcript_25437:399-1091(-)